MYAEYTHLQLTFIVNIYLLIISNKDFISFKFHEYNAHQLLYSLYNYNLTSA